MATLGRFISPAAQSVSCLSISRPSSSRQHLPKLAPPPHLLFLPTSPRGAHLPSLSLPTPVCKLPTYLSNLLPSSSSHLSCKFQSQLPPDASKVSTKQRLLTNGWNDVQPSPLPSPPSSSHSSSDNSVDAEVFFPPPLPVHPPSATQYTFPPIQLKNNQSFTEAELKAITPWRNQLLERLLANRSVTPGPPQNVPQRKVAGPPPKQRPPVVRPGTALFNDPGPLNEFNFGPGSTDYLGSVRRGTTAFLAIEGSINQANQGSGTVRAVVETILKFCLPRDLSEYSLTGKSLQEKLEVRNGQAQSRVVMAERGTSKQGVPSGLLAGMVGMFEAQLTEAGRRGAGGNLASYTRKLVSKTCSRSQEKKNQEVRTAASKRGKRDRNGNEL